MTTSISNKLYNTHSLGSNVKLLHKPLLILLGIINADVVHAKSALMQRWYIYTRVVNIK